MSTPKRIQRKRTKGWRMPENTVSVTRPGKWGNPFKVGEIQISGPGNQVSHIFWTSKEEISKCIEFFENALRNNELKFTIDDVIRELRGKNLACWCKEGPCHGDILLKLANS